MMAYLLSKARWLSVHFCCLFPLALSAQTELQMEHVSGNVWMLSGGGYANISVLAGDGRALMVDSKRPELADAIRGMIWEISGGEVEYLINGHVHPDHTDGNAGFGESGAVIIAHEEVRRVLMAGQRGGPPAPEAAWPDIVLSDGSSMTLYFDEETVTIIHAQPAHSLGNLMVHYQQSNVIHLGDLYSPERYPVLAGGSIEGFVEGNEMALALADNNTRFIAGNGIVTGRADVQAYIDMVKVVRDRVSQMISRDMDLDAVLAASPTAEFDATWGDPGRFLPGLYRELDGQ